MWLGGGLVFPRKDVVDSALRDDTDASWGAETSCLCIRANSILSCWFWFACLALSVIFVEVRLDGLMG